MRAAVPGLPTPYPLGLALPAVYHEDELAQRFLSALDDVLAPVFCTLDNLESYFDPSLTPPDFLSWLAGWLAIVLDENWAMEKRRALLRQTAHVYRWRGTVRGLAEEVALHTGVEPEIEESGGIVWSSRPGGPIPGTSDAHVRLRLRLPAQNDVNIDRLRAMIEASIPADVTYDLEVLTG